MHVELMDIPCSTLLIRQRLIQYHDKILNDKVAVRVAKPIRIPGQCLAVHGKLIFCV